MSDGNLNLRVLGQGGGSSAYDVVARIEGMDVRVPAVDLVLPSTATDGVDVTLNAGTYSVQLFMPSGRVLQQGFEVEAGTSAPLTFHEPPAGAASFSLQEASGDASLADVLGSALRNRPEPVTGAPAKVRRTPAKRPQSAGAATRSVARVQRTAAAGPRASQIAKGGLGRQQQAGGRVGRTKAGSYMEVAPNREVRRRAPRPAPVADPSAGLCLTPTGSFDGPDSWHRLASGPSGWGTGQETWEAANPDEERLGAAIWRLEPAVAGEFAGGARRWAVVRAGKGVEIVSLPAPWRCAGSGLLSPIDLLVDTRLGGRASSTVAIHDAALDGLLSYLDRGRLSALRPMVAALERSGIIERTIFEKMANPLAACAAAYVGLAVHEPAEQERWDSWLPNIMSRFPWLPDGAVVIHQNSHERRPSASR